MQPTDTITFKGITFQRLLTAAAIQQRVAELAEAIRRDYADKQPVFLVMLNGGALFAADLVRSAGIPCELSFTKLSSYRGAASSGTVDMLLPPSSSLENRHVIIVEDIVDTGNTLHYFLPRLQALQPASVSLASLLVKPDAMEHPIEVHYCGFEIEDRFVIGYGLDYDQQGRYLEGLYVKKG